MDYRLLRKSPTTGYRKKEIPDFRNSGNCFLPDGTSRRRIPLSLISGLFANTSRAIGNILLK